MDVALLQFFQSVRRPALTAFFAVFSFLGEGALFALAVAFLCFLAPKKGTRLLFAVSLSLCINCALKYAVGRERPFAADPVLLERVDTLLFSTVDLRSSSFPSGHAQTAAAFFAAVCVLYPRTWVYVCAFFAPFLTALSRVYFGVHYPSDVAAGLLFGAFAGAFAARERTERFAPLFAALALFAAFFVPSREYLLSAGLLAGCAVFPLPEKPVSANGLLNRFIYAEAVPCFTLPQTGINRTARLAAGLPLILCSALPVVLFRDAHALALLCSLFLAGALKTGAHLLFYRFRI